MNPDNHHLAFVLGGKTIQLAFSLKLNNVSVVVTGIYWLRLQETEVKAALK